MTATRAIARRTLGDSRVRTIAFSVLFFYGSAAQVLAYRSAYPTRAERLALARGFGSNQAVRLLYGVPHDLLTVGGWAAWRLGALTIFSSLWGLLAAVRALRAEEDAGRQELLLAGGAGRGTAFAGALGGIGAGALALWLALFAGLAVGRPGLGGAAYLALALLSPVPVFVGVGALTSQLAPTRRGALQIGGGVLGLALVARMVADTSAHLGGLRWATPLGWAEELRPFTGARPLVLLAPALAAALMLVAAERISLRRDVGAGLLPARDRAAPRLRLLSSPIALALRTLRGGLVAWLTGVVAVALILGVLADSVSSALSPSLREQFAKLGAAADTAESFLGFAFLFFVLGLSLFACFQLAAAREEATEQRLETLLALPVGGGRWFAGRLALAAAATAGLALVAGAVTWAGAASQGVGVPLWRMLEAGANCVPAALVFLGAGALALALFPRAGVSVAYGLVGAAFMWETVGALLGAPRFLLALSPFHDLALVPAAPFRLVAAAIMLTLAALAAAVAVYEFGRRDLPGP
jgi:polyether ionophore transport system permease protein